jgi:hypothetical protein
MSTTPITITVTYRNQAYHCRHSGVGASSTSNPQYAAQRLADKVFGEGTHRARMVRDCTASEPGEWAIEPATLPDPMRAASVRITLADDGHYYLDVRPGNSAAFRARSRHGDLDDALARARAVMLLETA